MDKDTKVQMIHIPRNKLLQFSINFTICRVLIVASKNPTSSDGAIVIGTKITQTMGANLADNSLNFV